MDVIEQTKRIGAYEYDLSDAQIARARNDVLHEIARGERPVRGRTTRWIGASALAAGLSAAAIVAGVVLSPGNASASASEVLRQAATVAAEGIPIEPGQYLEISSTNMWFALWDTDMPAEYAQFNNGDRNDAEAAFEVHQTSTWFVPADQSDDWVAVQSAPVAEGERYGKNVDAAVEAWADLPQEREAAETTTVYPHGTYIDERGDTFPVDSFADDYASMPRDPVELRAWFLARGGDEEAPDEQLIEVISEQLATAFPPADLRAAMLQVLADIPDIAIAKVIGDITTLFYSSSHDQQTTLLDVDTKRGLLVGVATLPHDSDSIIPSDKPDSSTSISVAVVDEAPKAP